MPFLLCRTLKNLVFEVFTIQILACITNHLTSKLFWTICILELDDQNTIVYISANDLTNRLSIWKSWFRTRFCYWTRAGTLQGSFCPSGNPGKNGMRPIVYCGYNTLVWNQEKEPFFICYRVWPKQLLWLLKLFYFVTFQIVQLTRPASRRYGVCSVRSLFLLLGKLGTMWQLSNPGPWVWLPIQRIKKVGQS